MNQRLAQTVSEVERHVAAGGWDQPPKLFALVDTAELVRREPALAATMGLRAGQVPPGSLTPIEQEDLGAEPLEEVLARMAWPAEVLGCAIVHEVVVLPEAAEAAILEDTDVPRWAAEHPQRRDVRMAVGVLRDGSRAAALRLRGSHPAEPGQVVGASGPDLPAGHDEVLTGPDLAPRLADALAATLAD